MPLREGIKKKAWISPPRGMMLDPIIPEKGLAMLYGARSVGKTRVAHGIGYAVASGTGFLRWQAPKPRRVLVVDGELPQEDLRQRVTEVRSAAERRAQYGHFTIISADRVDRGIGNLGSPVVQAEIESLLDGVELLVIDNLSSLTVGVRENDSDAWGEIQEWLLRLRRRGVSVLLIHHSGKTGGQRGTSQDMLDDYVSRFNDRRDQYARMIFAVHTPEGDLSSPMDQPVQVWTRKKIANLVVKLGLGDWVAERL